MSVYDSSLNGSRFANVLTCGVLVPLCIALLTRGWSVEASRIGYTLALLSHFIFFGVCALLVLFDARIKAAPVWQGLLPAFLGFLMMSGISVLSVVKNNSEIFSVGRVLLVIFFLFNYMLVLNFISRSAAFKGLYIALRRNILFGIYLVCFVSVYFFYSGYTPYVRLGYPLVPGVFAFYASIGLILSLSERPYRFIGPIFFFLCILASGSRFSIVFSIFAVIFLMLDSKPKNISLVIGGLGLILAVILWKEPMKIAYRVITIARDDVSSGRFRIWADALELLKENVILGLSYPPIFSLPGGLELRTHNSFLDLSLTYGIGYAIIAYAVWFTLFFPGPVKVHENKFGQGGEKRSCLNTRRCHLVLFLMVTLKSLITTTFWTNMADVSTLSVLLLISFANGQGYVECSQDSAGRQSHAQC